jgi:hypothetical protein
LRARSNIAGKTTFALMPSTNEGVWSTRARLTGRERGCQRRAGVDFGGVDAHTRFELAQHGGDPAGKSAAAPWNHHGVEIGQVLDQFHGDGAVAGHHVGIVESVDEGGVHARKGAGFESPPPIGERHQDGTAAEPLHGADLGGRRGFGRDDGSGDAQTARAICHSLRHIAGRRGEQAALQALARRPRDHVGRAADFERADRLQILQFQEQIERTLTRTGHQWRAQRDGGDIAAGFLYLLQDGRHSLILNAARRL